jgi:hypothetical protein
MRALRFLLALAFAAALCAGQRKPDFSIRFYVESRGNPGGQFTRPVDFKNPPRKGYLEAVPLASEKDVVAIHPVRHADGTIGCAFKFGPGGTMRLATTSSDRRGASMMIFFGTKQGVHQVIDLIIDKPVRDGIIYVPTGITPGELAMLEKIFPPMIKPDQPAKPSKPKKRNPDDPLI